MTNSNKLIKWFKGIAIFAIIWNIMGVGSYLGHVFMADTLKEGLTEAQLSVWENTPSWRTGAFAIAVFTGFIGSILLLLKKKLAYPIFLISLIAIIAGLIYDFGMSNHLEAFGNSSIIFPLFIFLIAVFLVWYSKKAIHNHLLS